MRTIILAVLAAMMVNVAYAQEQTTGSLEKDDPFKKDYQTWRKEMLNNYQNFRKKMLQDYADFARDPWSRMRLSPAEEKPEDEKIKPIIIDIDDEKVTPPPKKDSVKKEKETIISVLPLPQPLPAPDPVAPIKEDHSQTEQYRPFMFYGTNMKVRWSDDCAFHLKDINEQSIADAITVLSDKKYDNVLYDCLQLRSACHLSDWAYYLMLKELSASFCGKDTNEAALLLAMLFSQSGYRLRLAKSGQRLLLLISTQFNLYGYSYLEMDGHNYYLLDGDFESADVCKAQFPKEQEMSLIMKESPRLADSKSEARTITSPVHPQLTVHVSVNKNLIDFYATYPSSYFNNDFMTRWAMYANKEIQPEVREQLYPQLKAIIKDKSQRDGVENLLNWIQTAFKYEYDDKVWGYDRAFFAEESLFYPSCDCEDRSILFTRLVRDLLGLKCILVYYPGHLATGVCFTEDVEGDSIVINGNCYTICDPTLIGAGASVGTTMSGMNNNSANVVVLE